MKSWIALLRGINVGGRNRLPMKGLSKIFASAGCEAVKTYIQSGNVVFNADIESEDVLVNVIRDAIETEYGFSPEVHLIPADVFKGAIVSNPYPQAVSEPTSLHLFFLKSSPQSTRVSSANELLSKSETFEVVDRFLYLHAPDGIAQSKFAKSIDKALNVNTTARNWRTVLKLAELVSTIE